MEHGSAIRSSALMPAMAKIFSIILLLLAAVVFPVAGAKVSLAVFGGALFLAVVFLLPIHQSIMFFFFYLMVDGALKVLSNYHPVVHVGQDLYLLSLALRVAVTPGLGLRRWTRTPFFFLFVLFALSVAVQYVNPFGLGLLPSIAGTKVYFSGILLFFLVYHELRPAYVMPFCVFLVGLGATEALIACVEYLYFPEALFSLHSKYRALAGDRFIGGLYRPFGTTAAAGAPSLWVFLAAPFAYYVFTEAKGKWPRLLALVFFGLGLPTLVFCQTRAAFVLFAAMILMALLAPVGRWLPKLVLAAVVGTAATLFAAPEIVRSGLDTSFEQAGVDSVKAQYLTARMMTLTETKTYSSSRHGAWDKITELASVMPWGIGLSRVGAASAVWKERIRADQTFGKEWSFADNVYRALFTELGVFGLCSWLILITTLAAVNMRKSYESFIPRRRALLWISGAIPLVILVGGFGSEGVLYMPVGGFMWASMALGLKESGYV